MLPAALFTLVLLFSAVRASAELVRIDLIPSLRLQEEWTSNATNVSVSNQEVSSFATRIAPSLGIRLTAEDNVTIQFTGEYEKVWYHDRDARESDYDTWAIRVDSSGAWTFTPNLTMKPSVYFVNTEESTRRTELVSQNDPILSPVSTIMYSNVKRQSAGAALDFMYRISPVWNAGFRLDYSQERTKWKDPLIDPLKSHEAGVRASLSYAVSSLASTGFFAQASFIDFEDGLPDSQVYALGITYSYKFTPALHLSLDIGAAHLIRENELGSNSGKSETGPVGSIWLQYDRPAFSATLFGITRYSGTSGYGDVTHEYRAGIQLAQQFTQDVSGVLSGYYQHSQAVYQKDAVDIDTTYVFATLKYQPWEKVSFLLRGIFENQRSRGSFGEGIENYSVYMGVLISNPYSIY